MNSDVKHFIRRCEIFQRVEAENISSTGLLQPLKIPKNAWVIISMDIIEGLPVSRAHCYLGGGRPVNQICTFYSLSHPYKATTLAQIFIKNIFKLHGMSSSII